MDERFYEGSVEVALDTFGSEAEQSLQNWNHKTPVMNGPSL